ncbi:MAG: MalY/PatB family protein, partial [Pseudomonadota bacterium]
PDFDTPVNRWNTLCSKWDGALTRYGISGEDALPMWVADMDFRAPDVVQDALQRMVDHGVYGYMSDYGPYERAIQWWMRERHDWEIETDWILSTFGLVNAIGLILDVFTKPGDGVVVFSPVYHAFGRITAAADRRLIEVPLAEENGIYKLDMDAADRLAKGAKVLLFCSPHNPGGRVWSEAELTEIARFADRHDLLLVSDEIHQDLIYPGHKHTPMAKIEGTEPRLIMLNATSKTFNLAGHHTGNAIIPDPGLRNRMKKRLAALGLATNMAGVLAATAAYSPEGGAWVDALMRYLERNRQTFDAGIAAIPGLRSMQMQATYLAWVDFSGTGMSFEEIVTRVEGKANIAANHGPTFGKGGESFLRFNIATPHANIEEAVRRLQSAFGDLQ